MNCWVVWFGSTSKCIALDKLQGNIKIYTFVPSSLLTCTRKAPHNLYLCNWILNLSLYGLLAATLSEELGNFWHGIFYIPNILLKLFSLTALTSEPNTLIIFWSWLMSLPHEWFDCEPLQLVFLLIWALLVWKLDSLLGYDCNTCINLPHLISGLTAVY